MSNAPRPTRITLDKFQNSFPVTVKFLRDKVVSIGVDSGDILMAIYREDKILCYYFTNCGPFQVYKTNDPELLTKIEDLGPPDEDGMTHFVYAYIGVDSPYFHRTNHQKQKCVYLTAAEADLVTAWNKKDPWEQENLL
jgi:hypothetical protein